MWFAGRRGDGVGDLGEGDIEADIITFAVEGLITHKSEDHHVRAMCRALVDRHVGSEAPP